VEEVKKEPAMFRAIHYLLSVAILLALPLAAHGQFLYDATTNTTMADDNFQSGMVGSPPVATVGSWWGVKNSVVANATTAGIAAYSPSLPQFLNMTGDPVHGGTSAFLWANNAGATGDTIVSKFAFYLNDVDEPLTEAYGWLIEPVVRSGTDLVEIVLEADGGVHYYPSSGSTVALSQKFTPNAWNTMILSYQNNSSTGFSLSINGQTPETVALQHSGIWSGWRSEQFFTGTAANFYVSAISAPVPEPGTICLLLTGLLGLLAYAWRMRK
jgi:hypothetical protein